MPEYRFELTLIAQDYKDALSFFPPAWLVPGAEPALDRFVLSNMTEHHAEILADINQHLKNGDN